RRHTRSKRDWSSDVCSSDLLRPTPRRLGEFIREGAHGHRKLHALRAKEAELVAQVVLPVETGRGNPGVRQPEQRDVVEDVVARRSEERRVGKAWRSPRAART